MSSPTIADLPSASVVNDTDQLLLRQPAGALGTDKKVVASLLRQFNVSAFPDLPSNPVVDDLMSVSRAAVNYKIRFDQVSFIPGTQMWFYQNTAPSGWTVITAGDTLLAVKGGATYVSGGVSSQGTWQQEGATLDITQIPGHSHQYFFGDSAVSGPKANRPNLHVNAVGGLGTTQFTGGVGSTVTSGGNTAQPAVPHNHGNTWRPAAAVGVLCRKNNVV